jgi:MoaA/NifB/PqqE/SkfB family radical SAM enzyme
MVTGLISNGRRLKDPTYVTALEKAGLDFVQITLESHKPSVHDAMTQAEGSWKDTVVGIKNAVHSQIYVSTNTTISKQNADHFLTTIDYIKELGVDAFGCNSLIYSGKAPQASDEFALTIEQLKTLLPQIREKAQRSNLNSSGTRPRSTANLTPSNTGWA